MRGEASRIADRVSRDSLAPRLRDSGEDAWRIGNELFTITKVLDDSIQLERALTELLQGRALDALDGFPELGFDLEEVAEAPNLEIHFVDSSGVMKINYRISK